MNTDCNAANTRAQSPACLHVMAQHAGHASCVFPRGHVLAKSRPLQTHEPAQLSQSKQRYSCTGNETACSVRGNRTVPHFFNDTCTIHTDLAWSLRKIV